MMHYLRVLLVGLLLGTTSAAWATGDCRFLQANNFIQDTSYSSTKCSRPAWQNGQASQYAYMTCNGDDGSTPWAGGNFDIKVTDIIPADISTPSVHFQVVVEPRLNYSGGAKDVGFLIGGIAQDSSCNTASAKTFCGLLSSIDPTLVYTSFATLTTTTGACQGASDGVGVADGTSCTSDSTCTNDNQFCIGTIQYTTEDTTNYTPSLIRSADNSLDYCTVSTCAGQRIVYTIRLDDTLTTIERDFRILGLLVCYNR